MSEYTGGFFIYTTIISIIIGILFLFGTIFDKIIAKIGIRNIFRRPINTIIVVLGSMVGTSLISGSLAMSDSFNKVELQTAYKYFGEIDYQIEFFDSKISQNFKNTQTFISDEDVQSFYNFGKKIDLDGSVAILSKSISTQTESKNGETELIFSGNAISMDYEKIGNFGREKTNFNLIRSVKKDFVIITEHVAENLDLKIGSEVIIFNDKSEKKTFKVEKIYKEDGAVGINFGQTFFLNEEDFRNFFEIKSGWNSILASNNGDVLEGDKNFEKNQKEISSFFSNKTYSTKISGIKHEIIEFSNGLNEISYIFLAFSIFGIFAGILLIINIYSMLSEERKTELGIMRAIGFTKFQLLRSFLYEGMIYSTLASFVGIFVGVGIAKFSLNGFQNIFNNIENSTGSKIGIEIDLAISFKNMMISFNTGLILTFFVTIFAIWKITKLNIVEAIRNIENEKPKLNYLFELKKIGRKLLKSIKFFKLISAMKNFIELLVSATKPLVGFFIIFLGIFGFFTKSPYLTFTFLPLSATIFFNFLAKKIFKKEIISGIGNGISVFLTIFLVQNISFVKENFNSSDASKFLTTYFLLIMNLLFFLTVFVLNSTNIFIWIIGTFSKKWSKFFATTLISLKYPTKNKTRTGLTFLMFAVVIFAVVAQKIIVSGTVNKELSSATEIFGDYDGSVYFSSPKIVENFEERIRKSKNFSSYPFKKIKKTSKSYFEVSQINESKKIDYFDYLSTFNKDLIEKNLVLESKLDENLNNKEELEKILNSENMVLVGSNYSKNFIDKGYENQPKKRERREKFEEDLKLELFSLKAGDKIFLKNGDKHFEFIVGAVVFFDSKNFRAIENGISGIFISEEVFENLKIEKNEVIYQFKTKDDESLSQLNKNLQKEFNKNSAIISITSIQIDLIRTIFNSILEIFESFMLFSLIVGIAGVAIIAYRSIFERRQQIGLLRAIGFSKNLISLGFLIEFSSLAIFGILIGVISGSISSYLVISANESLRGVPYPTSEIVSMSILILLSSLFFVVFPLIKISKLKPVEALRYYE